MNSEARFFDAVRKGLLGPTLSPGEVSGCSAIMAAMSGTPIAWTAYALATAYKETAHTMQPVNELGGVAYFMRRYDITGQRPDIARELGNTTPGDGAKFHGRGYPQMTGKKNYILADAKLAAAGLIKPGELLADPDLALRDDIAAFIMRRGMQDGWFTNKTFSHFLPSHDRAVRSQFADARRIINGQDCADEIAGYACQFQDALTAGGWA
jgi:hypothetical protein